VVMFSAQGSKVLLIEGVGNPSRNSSGPSVHAEKSMLFLWLNVNIKKRVCPLLVPEAVMQNLILHYTLGAWSTL
jgi:hypothetical protein